MGDRKRRVGCCGTLLWEYRKKEKIKRGKWNVEVFWTLILKSFNVYLFWKFKKKFLVFIFFTFIDCISIIRLNCQCIPIDVSFSITIIDHIFFASHNFPTFINSCHITDYLSLSLSNMLLSWSYEIHFYKIKKI